MFWHFFDRTIFKVRGGKKFGLKRVQPKIYVLSYGAKGEKISQLRYLLVKVDQTCLCQNESVE